MTDFQTCRRGAFGCNRIFFDAQKKLNMQRVSISLKQHVYNILDVFAQQPTVVWKSVIDTMCSWTPAHAAAEIAEIKKQNARIEIDYVNLLKRELELVQCPRSVGADALNQFVRLYVRFLFITRDMQDMNRYLALTPKDRDLLARDAFDQSLIKVVADTINSESNASRGQTSEVVKSILDLDASVIAEHVHPNDSVSQAPSEVISMAHRSAVDQESVAKSVRELPRRRAPSRISRTSRASGTVVSRSSKRPESMTSRSLVAGSVAVSERSSSRLPIVESVASSRLPVAASEVALDEIVSDHASHVSHITVELPEVDGESLIADPNGDLESIMV